jgi:Rrf2 family cysteine metabolism transcriptional repressor
MAVISQKCEYALRAVFELAKQGLRHPLNAASIARNQSIPESFLENILTLLRQAGFVASTRGRAGGYKLLIPAGSITVGDIITAIDGAMYQVPCLEDPTACSIKANSPFDCVFVEIWKRAQDAMQEVYDSCTIQDLVEKERQKGKHYTYVI